MSPTGKRIVWLAMALSNVMMLLALIAMPLGTNGDPALGKALLILGAVMVPAAIVLPKILHEPQIWIAAMAVCETAAVCGIIAHAVAGVTQAWMLPVFSLVGTLFLFPAAAK